MPSIIVKYLSCLTIHRKMATNLLLLTIPAENSSHSMNVDSLNWLCKWFSVTREALFRSSIGALFCVLLGNYIWEKLSPKQRLRDTEITHKSLWEKKTYENNSRDLANILDHFHVRDNINFYWKRFSQIIVNYYLIHDITNLISWGPEIDWPIVQGAHFLVKYMSIAALNQYILKFLIILLNR